MAATVDATDAPGITVATATTVITTDEVVSTNTKEETIVDKTNTDEITTNNVKEAIGVPNVLPVIGSLTGKSTSEYRLNFTVTIDDSTDKYTSPNFSLGGWNWYIKLQKNKTNDSYGIFWVLADDVKYSPIKAQRINIQFLRVSKQCCSLSKEDYRHVISYDKYDWGFPNIISPPYSPESPIEYTFSTIITVTDSYNLKDAFENDHLSIKQVDYTKYNDLVEKLQKYRDTEFDENTSIETIIAHFEEIKSVNEEKSELLSSCSMKMSQLNKLRSEIRLYVDDIVKRTQSDGYQNTSSELKKLKELIKYFNEDDILINKYLNDINKKIITLTYLPFGTTNECCPQSITSTGPNEAVVTIKAVSVTTKEAINKAYLSKMNELFDEYTKYSNQMKPLTLFLEIVSPYEKQIESLMVDCKKRIKDACDLAKFLTNSILMYEIEKCSKYDVMLNTDC